MDVVIHSLLPFAVILLLLMVVHEAGHYITAKIFGVKVLEAGIGFPPRLFGFRWRETDYTVNALPLGAFVRLLGEEDPTEPKSLAAQPKWKRTVIIGAGAFMNLVLAVALFTVALMLPREVSAGGAQIVEVAPNSPAQHAGLEPGDQIWAVNGRRAESVQDASYLIRLYQGSNIDLTIKRDDPRTGSELIHKEVYSRWNPASYTDECGIQHAQGPTGITIGSAFGQFVPRTDAEIAQLRQDARDSFKQYKDEVRADAPASCLSGTEFGFVPLTAAECDALPPQQQAAARDLKAELFAGTGAACYDFKPGPEFVPFTKTRSEPPWQAIPHGARMSFESLIMARNQIWTWVRGYASPQVSGPVGIAQATGEVVEQAGWQSLIEFAALLSMNLAVLNVLPIPMFDGGRLVFILIEFLRGKRVAPEKEALVHLTGLVLIITLAVVITYFDVARIFQGDSLLR